MKKVGYDLNEKSISDETIHDLADNCSPSYSLTVFSAPSSTRDMLAIDDS